MRRASRLLIVSLACGLLLSACGGAVRRVSEPAASIQQLTVRTDGSWSVDLRLQNYSSIPMQFERVALEIPPAIRSPASSTRPSASRSARKPPTW